MNLMQFKHYSMFPYVKISLNTCAMSVHQSKYNFKNSS